MPALEYTAEERARDMANALRPPRETHFKLRPTSRPIMRPVLRELVFKPVVVEPSAPPPPPPPPLPPGKRHHLDAELYEFPLGLPAFVPVWADADYNPNRPVIRVKDVIADCARMANLQPDEILARSRKAPVIRPRQFAMWVIYTSPYVRRLSLPELGRMFGGRDHSTVLSAVNKVQALVDSGALDPENPAPWFKKLYYEDTRVRPSRRAG